MKNFFKKIYNSKYFPFIILTIIIFFIHTLTYSNGDDDFFRIQLDKYNLFEYLEMRYNTWSSRIAIETLFVTVTRLPFVVWQIIDTLIFVRLGILLSKIFNKNNLKSVNWIIVGLLLIYPFTDFSSAGYVCTTIAYLWPMVGLLEIMNVFKKIICNEKVVLYEYIISFIGLILSICFEQTLCLFIGLTGVLLIYLFYNKKNDFKKQWIFYLYMLIAIGMLIFTLTCPGNEVRTLAEIKNWYPEYESFGILSKIYLGIVPTIAVLLKNKIVVTFFSLLLTVFTFKKFKKGYLRTIAISQLLFVLVFGFLYKIILPAVPSIERFYVILNEYNTIPSLELNYILPLGFCFLYIISILYLLFKLFEKDLSSMIILGAGIASRFIMGFSPTVFASVDRTAFFMYIGFLIVSLLLIIEIINRSKKKLIKDLINYVLMSISAINILNVIYTLIIVNEGL